MLALAVVALALAAAAGARPASAAAAAGCFTPLIAANIACGPELAAVRDGKVPASVKPACCAAAADVFSASFGAECGCAASVAPYRSLLDRAQEAVASLCDPVAIAALPACDQGAQGRLAAASASESVAAADAPLWGNGAVCTAQDAPPTSRACVTKCTPRRAGNSPTMNQVATAKKCGTSRGQCVGLDPAGGASSGTTLCNEGVSVPDSSPRNGVVRTCYKCCTVRLAPVGTALGKNACRNPTPNGGGGGGGGGGGCFPGSATVVVEGRGPTPLRDVRVGDRVLTAKAGAGGEAAAAAYETVYWFGHRLESAAAEFVRLEVSAADDKHGPLIDLELTHKHLVPVLPDGAPTPLSLASAVYTRAQDVRAGARVLLVAGPVGSAPRAGTVLSVSAVARSDGLFAPLTTGGGHVSVNGVLASVHSNNMLDPLAEFLGRRDLLQWAYETFGAAPLKAAYRVFGPRAVGRANPLVAGLGLADAAQVAAGMRGLLVGGGKSA